MIIILSLLAGVTLLQLFVCHFTLWWLLSFIARGLFALRRIGALLPVRKLMILEGVAVALMLLFHLIFSKGNIPWGHIGLTLLFNIIVCAIMFFDDVSMVYETVDIDAEDNIL